MNKHQWPSRRTGLLPRLSPELRRPPRRRSRRPLCLPPALYRKLCLQTQSKDTSLVFLYFLCYNKLIVELETGEIPPRSAFAPRPHQKEKNRASQEDAPPN